LYFPPGQSSQLLLPTDVAIVPPVQTVQVAAPWLDAYLMMKRVSYRN